MMIDDLRQLQDIGDSYFTEFEKTGNGELLNNAIRIQERAVSLGSDDGIARPALMNQLGLFLQGRFKLLNQQDDLAKSIETFEQALRFVSAETRKARPGILCNLGNSLELQFRLLDRLSDLDKAIVHQRRAVKLRPDMPQLLNSLGISYQSRFEYKGELSNLEESIFLHIRAVTIDDNAQYTLDLGLALLDRFKRLGGDEDLQNAIILAESALEDAPVRHVSRPKYLDGLGSALFCKFKQEGNIADLDRALSLEEEAVSLVPKTHSNRSAYLNNISNMLARKYEHSGEPEYLDKAVLYQEEAVRLTPNTSITEKLEFLSSLGVYLLSRFERSNDIEDLHQTISCQLRSVELTLDDVTDKPRRLMNLGSALIRRYEACGNVLDIDDAISNLETALQLLPEAHADRPDYLGMLGLAYITRYRCLKQSDDLDQAIDFQSQGVKLTPSHHIDLAVALGNLAGSLLTRFECYNDPEDLDWAITSYQQAIANTEAGHIALPLLLGNLGKALEDLYYYTNDATKLDQSISVRERAVLLIPAQHVQRPELLNGLGGIYYRQYRLSEDIVSINKAVEYYREAVELIPEGYANQSLWLLNLAKALQDRYEQQLELSDVNQALGALKVAANASSGNPLTRYDAAVNWGQLAQKHGRPTVLEAYKVAIELIPRVVWLGRPTSARYSELIPHVHAVVYEAAEVAVSEGAFDLALEWLEQGRSIVWTQRMHLRNPVDALREHDYELASRLRQVARDLENIESEAAEDHTLSLSNTRDSLEQAARAHCRLADDWDRLVSEIREIPGFERFLMPKRLADLVDAARYQSVVVVNNFRSLCGALILPRGAEIPIYVPLPNLSHPKVEDAYDDLSGILQGSHFRGRQGRKPVFQTPDEPEDRRSLAETLAMLWTDVVEPVLESLGYKKLLPIDQLSRITWCTTDRLAFLPLHAAGLYDTPGAHNKAMNYVISSYSPTLAALTLPSRPSEDFYGMLAVGSAAARGQTRLPGTVEELKCIASRAAGVQFTQLDGKNATASAVLDGLEHSSWVHLACHASQNTKDPTSSAFYLHDGELKLGMIAKKALTQADFAFLSACQTAMGDSYLADEALHLAAGMLMAGYRTVIATMWSINDKDAPFVAEQVYAELLDGGIPDSTKAARALHKAVAELRDKIGENAFESWVPYIHLGL
ncbi:hypothetical protein FRC12_011300 [Ceratobasidium sp. 428]|nr:hypothetical protein FRC12_011300 [Ceratobasidium sp. 428]